MAQSLMFHSVALALALLVVTGAHAKRFEVKDTTDKVCTLLDAEFNLTVAMENNGTVENTLEVNQDTANTVVTGECEKKLTFEFDQGFKWVILFDLVDVEVELSRKVKIDTAKAFGITGGKSATVNAPDAINIGSVQSSYKCDGPLEDSYTPATEGDNTFTAIATISNLQVQAFNVENGDYSEATVCANATITTTPKAEDTTTPSANTTTPAVGTTLPSNETTTLSTQSTTPGKASGLVSSSFAVFAGLAMVVATIFV